MNERASHLEALMEAQILTSDLPTPTRELPFLKAHGPRFDFAWPDYLVAVEVEGGIWTRGRHVRPLGFERDARKYNRAAIRGWMVLRFTAKMLNDGEAIQTIREGLLNRGWTPEGGTVERAKES